VDYSPVSAKSLVAYSIALNALLGAGLFVLYRAYREARRPVPPPPLALILTNTALKVAKTNIIFKPREFTWQDIESTNYESYARSLRGFGCPESTVRDIIAADVNSMFAARRKTLLTQTNDMKWWRSIPDPEEVRALAEKERALEAERRELLARLLGPKWDEQGKSDLDALPLSGPVLEAMSEALKGEVQTIVRRSRLAAQDYLRECEARGEAPNRATLIEMGRELREELARQMTPPQLEEFMLRYSDQADRLRSELRGLEASPDEFRKLFAATESIDRELARLQGSDDPTAAAELERLKRQRQAAVRSVLGAERFEGYRMQTDPDYRVAMSDAVQVSAGQEAGRLLYEMNQAAATERIRINSDPDLTAAERQRQLTEVDVQLLETRSVVLGLTTPEPFERESNSSSVFTHQAGPHDTAAALALYYRVPLDQLLRANPGMGTGPVLPGQRVKIPEPGPLPWMQGIVPSK
jgi:uncharacterized protein YdcH (DUF465 family)